jgi:hypothetical protein
MLKCNTCSKIYKHQSEFDRHKNRKTSCANTPSKTNHLQCPKCDMICANKSNLNRHIRNTCNNTKSLVQTVPTQTVNNQTDIKSNINLSNKNQIICKFCNTSFTRKDTMKNHINKFCKIKKQLDKHDDKKQESINQIAKEMKEMKKEINELKNENKKLKNNKTTNNINSNNNTVNNNTINIKLVANSKEDLDFITNNDAYKFICRSANAIPELIKKLNFDKDKPENHNMYLPNFGSNTVCVYDGNDWMRTSLYDQMDHILDNKNNFLSGINDELKEKYSDHQKNAVRGFDRYLKWYDDDPKYKFGMYQRLRYILFNYRDMVLDTKKRNEQIKNSQSVDNLIKELLDNDELDEFIKGNNRIDLIDRIDRIDDEIKNDIIKEFMVDKIDNNIKNDLIKEFMVNKINVNILKNQVTNITDQNIVKQDITKTIDVDKSSDNLKNEFIDEYNETVNYHEDISNSDDEFIEDSD